MSNQIKHLRDPSIGKPRKRVATQPLPKSGSNCLRFRFDRVPTGGQFCLSKITPTEHVDLLNKLKSFETMKATDAFSGSPGKDYQLDNRVPTILKKNINAIGDDIDMVSRLALGGKPRLYGIRNGNEFSILWWDPEHQLWPSAK